MNDLHLDSSISGNDYTRLLFMLTYRKPMIIIISFFGLLMFVLSVLYFFDLYTLTNRPPYLPFLTGIFIIIIFPTSIVLISKRNYKSEVFLHENVLYTFTNDKVFAKGDSFAISFGWDKIYKIRYLQNWILFYQDKTRLSFMIKNSFTPELDKEFKQLVNLNKIE